MVAAGEVVPRLLDVYFDVIIQHGLSSHLHELLPVLFERVDQVRACAVMRVRLCDCACLTR